MEIRLKQGSLTDIKADIVVINLFEGVKTPGGATGAIDKALDNLISSYVIEKEGFKGKLNEIYVLHTHGKIPADKVLIVGLGKSEEFELNKIREVASKVIKKAKALKTKSIVSILHGAGTAGLDPAECAQAIAEGSLIGNYSFSKYKSDDDDEPKEELELFTIVEMDQNKLEKAQSGIEKGGIIAEGVNFARDLVNEPPDVATPALLAETALSIKGIECRIIERDEAEKLGMGAFLAVAKGSEFPPKFIHMSYKPKGVSKKKVAIIGKGITFDSGGLDIKPASGMVNMKDDMAGAAAVIVVMRVLPLLKPDVEVHGIVAAC